MSLTIRVVPHPFLDAAAFLARLHEPLLQLAAPATLIEPAPLASSDVVKTAVRELLRHGGYKPSGRSKPASEYLIAAKAENRWPQINALVDTCNVVSLCSGLPISIVDLDRVRGELSIAIAAPGTTYVFNPSGQVIDASGLVCLCDAEGPTGTPVKDAQRTKTHDGTTTVLAIVWGTRALPGRTAVTVRWYRELMSAIAAVEDVELTASS